MKIAISAESTVDLTKELIETLGVKIVPFSVLLGDDNYLDGEITTDQIIEFVDKNNILPKKLTAVILISGNILVGFQSPQIGTGILL